MHRNFFLQILQSGISFFFFLKIWILGIYMYPCKFPTDFQLVQDNFFLVAGFALEGFQNDGEEFSQFEDKEFVDIFNHTLV